MLAPEPGVPSLTILYLLGHWVAAEIEVVSVVAPLLGRPLIRRCFLLRLGQTSEGHSYPQSSWFGDGKLGFRPRAKVAAYTRLVNITDNSNLPSMPQ